MTTNFAARLGERQFPQPSFQSLEERLIPGQSPALPTYVINVHACGFDLCPGGPKNNNIINVDIIKIT